MIGWSDPFPDDDKFIKGSIDDEIFKVPKLAEDWVYPEQRYVQDNSP